MERRSFLKLVGLFAGAVASGAATPVIEETAVEELAKGAFLRVGGLDVSRWFADLVLDVSRPVLEVTSWNDADAIFVPGLQRAGLEFNLTNLPARIQQRLVTILEEPGPVPTEFGYFVDPETSWSWSFLSHMRRMSETHIIDGDLYQTSVHIAIASPPTITFDAERQA